jgi:hypothetical protein
MMSRNPDKQIINGVKAINMQKGNVNCISEGMKSTASAMALNLLLLLSTSCSNIMEPMQNFTPNQYPSIESVTWSPSGSTSLDPNTPVTINVQGSDPDGDSLTFSFDSEMGSFTSQSDSATASTVTFYPAAFLVSSQAVTIKVKVSDPKGYSVSRQYDLGSTKAGPTITMKGEVIKYVRSGSQVIYTLTANDSGICRLKIGGVLKTSSFYSAGEEATVTVAGSDLSGQSQTVEIELDSLMGADTYSFPLNLDDDPPSSSLPRAEPPPGTP